MGIKWNPDFDRDAHKQKVVVNQQALLRKTGAITYVKTLKKKRLTPLDRVKKIAPQSEVQRDFVFSGALVKLVGFSRKIYDAKFCTVLSEEENAYRPSETMHRGKWWTCILPDGRTVSIESSDMRPIDVQNGNIETSIEDEETNDGMYSEG